MGNLIIILTMLALCASIGFAQDESEKTVTIMGTAATQISADEISWSLTMTVKNKKQDKLAIQADAVLTQILNSLDQLGFNRDDVVISNANTQKKFRNRRNKTPKFTHFELSQAVSFTLEDVEKNDEYWEELTAIEGLRINRKFMFSNSLLEPVRRQLRSDALQSAIQKADEYVEVEGGSVGETLTISELRPNSNHGGINRTMVATGSGLSNHKEKMDISSQIYVTFELE